MVALGFDHFEKLLNFFFLQIKYHLFIACCVLNKSSKMTPFMSLSLLAYIYKVFWQQKLRTNEFQMPLQGSWVFSISTCKNRNVQNDKMAITFLFSLKIERIRALYFIKFFMFHNIVSLVFIFKPNQKDMTISSFWWFRMI